MAGPLACMNSGSARARIAMRSTLRSTARAWKAHPHRPAPPAAHRPPAAAAAAAQAGWAQGFLAECAFTLLLRPPS